LIVRKKSEEEQWREVKTTGTNHYMLRIYQIQQILLWPSHPARLLPMRGSMHYQALMLSASAIYFGALIAH